MKKILLFNGYTFNKNDLPNLGDNVLIYDGYFTENQLENIANEYENPLIVGYSFGCFYANNLKQIYAKNNVAIKSIAICGTGKILNKKIGIHPITMRYMYNNLNNDVMHDFHNKINYSKAIDLNLAKSELMYMLENYKETEDLFDLAIIAKNDLIFDANKLNNFYKNTVCLKGSHYIFKKEENIEKIAKILSNWSKF